MIYKKKYGFRDLSFVADFDEIGLFLGLGSGMGLIDGAILDFSHPAGTISDQFYLFMQSYKYKNDKTALFPPQIMFSEIIGTFWVILNSVLYPAVSGFLNFSD